MNTHSQLLPLEERHLDELRKWRNHDDIRPYMINQHQIGAEEHRAWFNQLAQHKERKAFVYCEEHLPMGFVQFDGVKERGISTWGFYKAPHAPKGTGQTMLTLALQTLFNELNVHKVAAQVLASNTGSIHLHKKLGFTQEGILRKHVLLGENWHDLVCFGLLDTEYLSWK